MITTPLLPEIIRELNQPEPVLEPGVSCVTIPRKVSALMELLAQLKDMEAVVLNVSQDGETYKIRLQMPDKEHLLGSITL